MRTGARPRSPTIGAPPPRAGSIPRHEDEVEVRFGGQISPSWDSLGHYHAEHTGYTAVIALPRDMLIAGDGAKEINTLRLWDAMSPNSLDMYLFSEGAYVKKP